METKILNKQYYSLIGKTIKAKDEDLWTKINNHIEDDIKFKEKFYLYENNIKNTPKCYCGKAVKFIDMISGYREYCSRRCSYDSFEVKQKRKSTTIEKYGVDNVSKSNLIKEKVKATNNIKFGVDYPLQNIEIVNKSKVIFIEKYGVDNPSKVKEVRDKAKSTMMEKYGVEYAMHNVEIKDKVKKIFIEKYGVDNPFKLTYIRNKIKSTMMERYGVEYALKHKFFLNKMLSTTIENHGNEFFKTQKYKDSIKKRVFESWKSRLLDNSLSLISINNSRLNIFCDKCESEFEIEFQMFRKRVNHVQICKNCNPAVKSKHEKEVLDFIRLNYKNVIIENYRDKIEIDIYLPELKLGIEFNGLYWHSELFKDDNYHIDKKEHFNKKGISMIQIWEDDWINRKEIIKSILIDKLNLCEMINNQECEIKEIKDSKEVKYFLVENDIQGFHKFEIGIGMYKNQQLITVVTFNMLSDNDWEMNRFCYLKGIKIIDGYSILLNLFIEKFNPNKIIINSANDYNNLNICYPSFFKLEESNIGKYFWIKNKLKYNMEELAPKEMYKLGYFKVFTSGVDKYTYKKMEA